MGKITGNIPKLFNKQRLTSPNEEIPIYGFTDNYFTMTIFSEQYGDIIASKLKENNLDDLKTITSPHDWRIN